MIDIPKGFALMLLGLLLAQALGIATPSSDFVVILSPNPTMNFSQNLSANVTPYNNSLHYLFSFRNWTSQQSDFQENNSTYQCLDASACATRIFVDVVANDSTGNSSTITNFTLVFSATQTTQQQDYWTYLTMAFYTTYAPIIIGLFGLGIAYAFGGTLSGTALIASVIYCLGYLLISSPILLWGAIALFIIGLILKYAMGS